MYRHLSAVAPFVIDVTEPYCGSKLPPKSAGINCNNSLSYRDYSSIFYRHDTALQASVFRKTPKMTAIKCLKWLPHKNFSINFLPSGHPCSKYNGEIETGLTARDGIHGGPPLGLYAARSPQSHRRMINLYSHVAMATVDRKRSKLTTSLASYAASS